jgi:hypothetical protein
MVESIGAQVIAGAVPAVLDVPAVIRPKRVLACSSTNCLLQLHRICNRFLYQVVIAAGRLVRAVAICGLLSASSSAQEGMLVDGSIRDVQALHQSGDTLWFGSFTRLYRLRAPSTKPELVHDFDPEGVLSVYQLGNDIWLGVGHRLLKWNIDFSGTPTPIPVDTGYVDTMVKTSGALWFGGEKGLFRLDEGGAPYPRKVPIEIGEVHGIYVTDGELWAGGDSGLFVCDLDEKKGTRKIPLRYGGITPLAKIDQTFWFSQNNAVRVAMTRLLTTSSLRTRRQRF